MIERLCDTLISLSKGTINTNLVKTCGFDKISIERFLRRLRRHRRNAAASTYRLCLYVDERIV